MLPTTLRRRRLSLRCGVIISAPEPQAAVAAQVVAINSAAVAVLATAESALRAATLRREPLCRALRAARTASSMKTCGLKWPRLNLTKISYTKKCFSCDTEQSIKKLALTRSRWCAWCHRWSIIPHPCLALASKILGSSND